MAGEDDQQIQHYSILESNDRKAEEKYYATLLNNAIMLPRKLLLEEMNSSMDGYEVTVSHYTSSEVFDDMKSDHTVDVNLEGLINEARSLKPRLKKKSDRGFRVPKKPLVQRLIPYIYNSTKVYRIAATRKWKVSAAKICRRLYVIAIGLKYMIKSSSPILRKRAAQLTKIVVDDEEDYMLAVEAKNAGFTGTLVLTNQLSVSQSEEIEEDAIAKGFKIHVMYTLAEKRKAKEDAAPGSQEKKAKI
ncbi:uncharacterized protein LOC141617211 [Silene latifolia]|uniref:uncharacterized protein LOC141617211 n=1 Tax=Silene latifolia TaxID=37657 RepID=UPI003D76C7BE